MIPRIIHYCWFGNKPLAWDAKKCIKSWEKYCPDYEIRQWDEENFDVSCHPYIEKAYEAKYWAFVSDYARLKIVHENGGIYLDTDVEILRNLDDLTINSFYIGCAQDGYISSGLGFGAEKGSHIVKNILSQYDYLNFDQKNLITCPVMETRYFKKLGWQEKDSIQNIAGAVIYPPEYFDPISVGNKEILISDKSFSIHHYASSWQGRLVKTRRKIIMFLGTENIEHLKKILRYKK